jgi:hypothetical protein
VSIGCPNAMRERKGDVTFIIAEGRVVVAVGGMGTMVVLERRWRRRWWWWWRRRGT